MYLCYMKQIKNGIKTKKKICSECGRLQYMFSRGRCKSCANVEYMKKTKQNRINKLSKKKPKKKRRTVTQLKNKLWRIFSQYIRLRDSNNDGICKCITCGKEGKWTKDGMEAGHFISRRYNSTFVHEKNVHAQCTACNSYRSGEQYVYSKRLDEIYDEGTSEFLYLLSKEEKKFTLDELDDLYLEYSIKVENLLKSKRFK